MFDIDQKPVDCEQMSNKEIIILSNMFIKVGELTFLNADDLKQARANDRRIQNVCNYLFVEQECYKPR